MQFSCLLNPGAEGLRRAQRETDRGRKVGKQPKHFRNQKAKEHRDDVLKKDSPGQKTLKRGWKAIVRARDKLSNATKQAGGLIRKE